MARGSDMPGLPPYFYLLCIYIKMRVTATEDENEDLERGSKGFI